jgi:hypothetical protein
VIRSGPEENDELRAGTAVIGILPLAISVLGEQQIPLGTIGVLSRSVGRVFVDATCRHPACNDCEDNIYLERLSQVLRGLSESLRKTPLRQASGES